MLILDYLLHNFYDPPQELVDQVIVESILLFVLTFIMLDIIMCYTPPQFLSNELAVISMYLHINPCLVLVQPRKTPSNIAEKLLTGT